MLLDSKAQGVKSWNSGGVDGLNAKATPRALYDTSFCFRGGYASLSRSLRAAASGHTGGVGAGGRNAMRSQSHRQTVGTLRSQRLR